jgi:hypothetical protein
VAKDTCGYIQPWQIELVLGEKFPHSLRLRPFKVRQLRFRVLVSTTQYYYTYTINDEIEK